MNKLLFFLAFLFPFISFSQNKWSLSFDVANGYISTEKHIDNEEIKLDRKDHDKIWVYSLSGSYNIGKHLEVSTGVSLFNTFYSEDLSVHCKQPPCYIARGQIYGGPSPIPEYKDGYSKINYSQTQFSIPVGLNYNLFKPETKWNPYFSLSHYFSRFDFPLLFETGIGLKYNLIKKITFGFLPVFHFDFSNDFTSRMYGIKTSLVYHFN